MRVIVHNLRNDTARTFEGAPAEVERELYRIYPFLNSEDPDDHGDIPALVEHLNSVQDLEAEIEDYGDAPPLKKSERTALDPGLHRVVAALLGHRPKLERALAAARFLTGGQPAGPHVVRQALWDHDGDPERAALAAHGLEPAEANLKALRVVDALQKAGYEEPKRIDPHTEVVPADPDGREAADQVRRAFEDLYVIPVNLGGKHSAGSLLARDDQSGVTWLLKPNAGGVSPAAGEHDDPSTQARREAAFWHLADAWGMGQYYPRTELLLVGGHEYAAIELLPWRYHTLDEIKEQHPGAPQQLLHPYLRSGVLHRWAALDAVAGNSDRHANNLMAVPPNEPSRDGDGGVKLIDQGAAFAGVHFDPVHDQYSFVPFYLRAWAPPDWKAKPAAERLRLLPRTSPEVERDLRQWIGGLHAEDVDRVLLRYGVDPAPEKERLARLKAAAAAGPADQAVNEMWVRP